MLLYISYAALVVGLPMMRLPTELAHLQNGYEYLSGHIHPSADGNAARLIDRIANPGIQDSALNYRTNSFDPNSQIRSSIEVYNDRRIMPAGLNHPAQANNLYQIPELNRGVGPSSLSGGSVHRNSPLQRSVQHPIIPGRSSQIRSNQHIDEDLWTAPPISTLSGIVSHSGQSMRYNPVYGNDHTSTISKLASSDDKLIPAQQLFAEALNSFLQRKAPISEPRIGSSRSVSSALMEGRNHIGDPQPSRTDEVTLARRLNGRVAENILADRHAPISVSKKIRNHMGDIQSSSSDGRSQRQVLEAFLGNPSRNNGPVSNTYNGRHSIGDMQPVGADELLLRQSQIKQLRDSIAQKRAMISELERGNHAPASLSGQFRTQIGDMQRDEHLKLRDVMAQRMLSKSERENHPSALVTGQGRNLIGDTEHSGSDKRTLLQRQIKEVFDGNSQTVPSSRESRDQIQTSGSDERAFRQITEAFGKVPSERQAPAQMLSRMQGLSADVGKEFQRPAKMRSLMELVNAKVPDVPSGFHQPVDRVPTADASARPRIQRPVIYNRPQQPFDPKSSSRSQLPVPPAPRDSISRPTTPMEKPHVLIESSLARPRSSQQITGGSSLTIKGLKRNFEQDGDPVVKKPKILADQPSVLPFRVSGNPPDNRHLDLNLESMARNDELFTRKEMDLINLNPVNTKIAKGDPDIAKQFLRFIHGDDFDVDSVR